MTRVAPGYYTDKAIMELDGKLREVTVSVVRAETTKPNWYSEIELDGHVIFDGSDWYPTKRECDAALTTLLNIGAKRVKGFGWCTNA